MPHILTQLYNSESITSLFLPDGAIIIEMPCGS